MEHTADQLKKLEEAIQKGNMARMKASVNRDNLRKQYEEANQELEELGVDPKNVSDAIQELEESIAEKMKQVESLIPFDVLNEYNEAN